MGENFQRKQLKITDVLLIMIAWVGGLGLFECTLAPAAAAREIDAKKGIIQNAMKLQTTFITNQGQIKDDRVRFYAKTFGGTLFITAEGEMVYSFSTGKPRAKEGKPVVLMPQKMKSWALKERLVGASNVCPAGIEQSETKVNYFIGRDKSRWKTNLATYNAVNFGEVYKGIELSLKAYGNTVEKVFTVKPGTDPKTIKLKMEGASFLRINDQAELEAGTGIGVLRFSKPVAYQEKDGKKQQVRVAYYLSEDTYGFSLGEYDKTHPLVIDPFLSYSTYLGGSSDDGSDAIAVDATGCVYLTGWTTSTNFPITPGVFQDTLVGNGVAIVAKLSADGTELIFSTFLGGSGSDAGDSIALDDASNIYVTGRTNSTDFPITPGVFQEDNAGDYDIFITKLGADGSQLIFSTYLGGSARDMSAYNVALDDASNVYVTGRTNSTDFPITSGAFQETYGGGPMDGYLSKVSADGSELIFSTFLGGSSSMGVGEEVHSIVLDTAGHVYVTGVTDSTDFPITSGAFQETYGGAQVDGFIAKFSVDGSALIFSTFLGSSSSEGGRDIAVDATGHTYVTGPTSSTNFPVTPGAFQGILSGGNDVFVTKLSVDGSALIFSTFLGGTNSDWGNGIALDAAGNVYVTGGTMSTDFPIIEGAFQENYGGGFRDVFISKLSADGSALIYSTYLGGSGADGGYYPIALDAAGNVYVAGSTTSTNFPITEGSFQGGHQGGYGDVFVAITLDYPDLSAPFIIGQTPFQGQTNVAIDTNIVVHVRDDGAGVNLSTIIMTVEDTIVYDGSDPDYYPNTTVTGNLSDFTLTYDPPADFSYEQQVNVTVEAADLAGQAMAADSYSFMAEPPAGNPWEPGDDDDEDGISNGIEHDLLGTDYTTKTLFVRPKQLDGSAFVYWPGFIALFPDARSGFADIPAFGHAGIEISVIGDTGNPYGPMGQFSYDPATDPNHPPCDIIEIIYMPDDVYCTFGHHNLGHTYFYSLGTTWYWDTKGYVPNDQASPHFLKHRYFTPLIYPFPLDNYLNEGAYPQVGVDQRPMETTDCGLNQCYDTNYSSPLNLNDSEATAPYSDPPDGTVEFNQIIFDSNKQILFVGSKGIRYDRDTVMRRTLTHEIGHALLAASEADHCTDVQCMLYHSVADWEMRDFGPGNCVHKPGGSKDIRTAGVVHNSVH